MIKRRTLNVIDEVLIFITIMAGVHLIYGGLTPVTSISNTGVIASANLQIYWENQCVNAVTSVNWGYIEIGKDTNVTVFVKNTGTVPLTLSLMTSNWNPMDLGTYCTLAWDYSGDKIETNSVMPVILILKVSPDTQEVTNFQFQITITGTQVS
jgi:hypothetical protein